MNIKLHTMATNASNLQKHPQVVLLFDSLRKQSTIGTQGAIIHNFAMFLITFLSNLAYTIIDYHYQIFFIFSEKTLAFFQCFW